MNPSFGDAEAPQNKSFRRWIFIGAIALVLLVVGIIFARPAYRGFKSWRSQRLAAEAEHLLERNELERAQAKAQSALLLSPNGTPAIHAMAVTLTRATNVAALQYWAQYIKTGHASEADRQTFVELCIRAGVAGAAAPELQKLLSEAPQQPANFWLASQLFVLLGDRAQTVQYASQAASLQPTNRQYNLFISSLEFDVTDSATRAVMRSNVWARAGENDVLGMQALEFLASQPNLPPAQCEQLIKLLRQHPLRSTRHDLITLGLELEASPKQRSELLDKAIEKHKSATPEVRMQFAVWLNQNREFERTLTALPLDEALKRKEYFLAYTDALAALGRWAELNKIIESPQAPLEPAYAKAFRARCESQLKNAPLAELYWRDALRAAERNPEQLYWLALYTEKCGELDLAKKSWRDFISCTDNPRGAFRELERITERSGTTAELRDVVAEMVQRWPEDVALQNDQAYLNLLLSNELADSARTAEKLVSQFPASLSYRTTFALALYRQKNAAGAMSAYAGQRIDWSGAMPGQIAVYAAVLAENEHVIEAQGLARRLDRGQLRPEEWALVSRLQ